VKPSTESLALAAARHPWRTVGIWIAVVVLSVGIVATMLEFSGEGEVTSETDSKRAERLLAERFPPSPADVAQQTSEVVVVSVQPRTVDDPTVEARTRALADELREAGATSVITFFESGEERLVSEDRTATAVLVGLPDVEAVEGVVDTVERLDAEPGYEAAATGELTFEADFEQLSLDDLRKGELFFGAPAALIILLLVFGRWSPASSRSSWPSSRSSWHSLSPRSWDRRTSSPSSSRT
jgi:uncharacterized membrane protein YdfJ with MMPL/SSD domain